MTKDFAFLFKPGDYLRDTQCLSEKTQVAYDRIMCEHMRNICITQQQLNFFTKRLSQDELDELMFMLKKVKGGFEIEWVAESIRERITYSESRRKNRQGKITDDIKTYVPHMEGEGEDKGESVIKEESVIENIISPEIEKLYYDILFLFPDNFRPKTKVQISNWQQTLEKLVRIDKHPPGEIIKVITWAREDSFWKGNFLSVLKLRDKNKEDIKYFDIFQTKMNNVPVSKNAIKSSDYEN